MTAPDSPLDDRQRAVYGRLHVHGLKAAILLAALDWADQCAEEKPVVYPAHWFRAQQIVETWRASVYRLLRQLGESEKSRLEDRILRLLKAHPEGMTARNIYKNFRSPRKTVLDLLNALEQDNQVARTANQVDGVQARKQISIVWWADAELGNLGTWVSMQTNSNRGTQNR